MKNNLEKWRLFGWRLLVLAITAIFLIRLFDLQVVSGTKYRQIANDNRLFQRAIPAERGVILDRYDHPLTLNAKKYYLLDDPKAIFSNHQQISQTKAMTWMATDSARINFDHYRVYPWGSSLAHVLGYIGQVTVDELKQNKELSSKDLVGKLGLEKKFQRELKGVAGSKQFEINAPGERQRTIKIQPAVPGQNIKTSIDPYLSQVAELAMDNQPGAVIINDIDTGQILAMVSSPSFDPNLLTDSALDRQQPNRQDLIKNLFSNPNKLFFNRAVAGAYPPGSIFKLVTALAGLENKVIDAQTTVVDEGVLQVGDFSYANWYYTQYGRVEGALQLVQALTRSNDIFFYKAAEFVGPDRLADMAQLLGMGKVTGVEIGSEVPGLIPNPSWKEEKLGERWFLGNTYHMGIGQGDVLVTPIQIAQLVQTVINGDQICRPSLLMEHQSFCEGTGLADKNVELVREGMIGACSAGGTGLPFFKYNAQFTRDEFSSQKEAIDQGMVACKTGTAEFGGVRDDGYRRTHAWFVMGFGFHQEKMSSHIQKNQEQTVTEARLHKLYEEWRAGLDRQPMPTRIAMTVLLESTDAVPYREGSRDAAPIAKKIMDWMYSGEF